MRNKLTICIFLLIIGGAFVMNIVMPKPDTLTSERRKPAAMPPLTAENVMSGGFGGGFEDYAADNFWARDQWRFIRAAVVYGVFLSPDKDGVYIGKSGVGKFEDINEQSWRQVTAKINTVSETLTKQGLRCYAAFIPDKSVYSGGRLPGFDMAVARKIFGETLSDDVIALYLDWIGDTGLFALRGTSFYKTDLHWDQFEIAPLAAGLSERLGAAKVNDIPALSFKTAGDFKGVYYGQSALPIKPDNLVYYDAEADGITARYVDEYTLQWRGGAVNDLDGFNGRDPYDIFLRGTQPLVELTNSNPLTDKHLYLFRDSFGSSLAPLLARVYAKVTLIDLRYVDWRVVPMLVDFERGSDALFLYSSQALNNSSVILVE